MKPFTFSLERMRDYKTQLLSTEKATLALLRKEKDTITGDIAALEDYRGREYENFLEKQRNGVTAADLTAHNFIMTNTRRQQEDLAVRLAEVKEKVAAQLKVVVAISQELNGLDKLEEKQREEYRIEAGRANEREVAEHISIRLAHRTQSR